jgi:hypothetical protein
MEKESPRFPISVKVNRKTYRGAYWMAGNVLVVSTNKGGISESIGWHSPEPLAKQLLLELAKEGRA